MDRGHFDALACSVATRRSRRAAIAALLGATLLGQLPAVVDAKRKGNGKNRNWKRGQRQHGDKRQGAGKGKDGTSTTRKRKERGTPARAEAAACCASGNCTPGKGKNLAKCCYHGQDLTGATFKGANLGQATFFDATLTNATFTGANLGRAILCRTTMPDGSENNSGCGKGTPCCPTCDAENSCDDEEFCDGGRCRQCDVCSDGCAFATVAAAVAGTASGGTIRICPGAFPTNDVTIAKDLTLLGAGAGGDPRSASILDAGEQGRVLVVAAGATVTLRRLTVANGHVSGRGAEGGCIHNAGDLTLDGAVVSGCVAASPDLSFGGGIFNRSGGVVMLDRTTITDCSAERGGGISNESGGSVTLDNSTVAGGFTGIVSSGALTLKGTTRIAGNNVIGVENFAGTVVCAGAPRVCGNPNDATATATTNCIGVTAASCAGVCLGDATPGSGACPA